MCYTEILIKENKLKKKKRDRCYYHCFMLLNCVHINKNSKKKKKREVVVMLLVKDFFGGKPGGNCFPDFDLEHDRICIF